MFHSGILGQYLIKFNVYLPYDFIIAFLENRMLISKQNKANWTILQTTMWMNFKTMLCKKSQDPKDYTLYDFIYMKEKLI